MSTRSTNFRMHARMRDRDRDRDRDRERERDRDRTLAMNRDREKMEDMDENMGLNHVRMNVMGTVTGAAGTRAPPGPTATMMAPPPMFFSGTGTGTGPPRPPIGIPSYAPPYIRSRVQQSSSTSWTSWRTYFTWKYACIFLLLLTAALASVIGYFLVMHSFYNGFGNCSPKASHSQFPFSANGYDAAVIEVTTSKSSTASTPRPEVRTFKSKLEERDRENNNQGPSLVNLTEYGKEYPAKLEPFHFYNTRLDATTGYYRLNFSIPWKSNFAIYGRRNIVPTITHHNFFEFVKEGTLAERQKRSSGDFSSARGVFADDYAYHRNDVPVIVNVSIVKFLDTGLWYISVYNDDFVVHEVSVMIEPTGVTNVCPNACSGHGSCYLGKCDCYDGYAGYDCSKIMCPILCSNHGHYGGGLCHCNPGWKGTACDVPEHDCQVHDCSGHGTCVKGNCECQPGWQGSNCDAKACLDPTCSNHGECALGKCYCKAGWQGENCSTINREVFKCLPHCNHHGLYDLETGTCKCDDFWTGPECSAAVCDLNCGLRGHCIRGKCKCNPGWSGERCDQLPCDPRCSIHGQCKNGTCVCSTGWNGKHCTLAGCPRNCMEHGICLMEEGEYFCKCESGWAGEDCNVRQELTCDDEIDNDNDGLKDCEDSECCPTPACKADLKCLLSNDPVEVLLRKQPPSVTASFYQRVKFLIEENSVQSYAHVDEFSERRVSVIRGQLVSPDGFGVQGARVSVNGELRYGFTVTRADGWFDLLVNGGEVVTLQLLRYPYKLQVSTVFAPWNQITVTPPIVMQYSDDSNPFINDQRFVDPPELAKYPILEQGVETCFEHNESLLNPHVLSTWAPEKIGGSTKSRLIYLESQVLQESIKVPGLNAYLLYRNSLAPGFLSYLLIRITGTEVPPTLDKIYIHVEIEGSIFTKLLEADPNLTYTFAWDKRNCYKQKVYGITHARVSIGYSYSTCKKVIWERHAVTMKGFEVDTSDIGGWSLDVHHHYNFHEGVLQKGDGSSLYMKYEYPRAMRVEIGTGEQRVLLCKDCDGLAHDAKLLMPVALTHGPDGSLYIGDFNLVRRLLPDGSIYSLLQLSPTEVSYKYYLFFSSMDGKLYVSDPEKRQILRIVNMNHVADATANFEVVAGSGERCIPGDAANCGDGEQAISAKLAHPKGIAIGYDNTLYFADGMNIRSVDTHGIIHTLVGHHKHNTPWQPIPCNGALPASQVQLQWPTGMAINPLDGTLNFIDDQLVLKVTTDKKIRVVAGVPLHCHQVIKVDETVSGRSHKSKARFTALGPISAIAFGSFGELYLAQNDAQTANVIKIVDFDGLISEFAGSEYNQQILWGNCDCQKNATNCQCYNKSRENLLATTAKFGRISAVTSSPDGVLHVADQDSLHILSLHHYLPSHDYNGEYQIPYPATNELYTFNRYGQHITTRHLQTRKLFYKFVYSKNTSFGKLSSVSDDSGNKITLMREYSNMVSSIESSHDYKADLNISGSGLLIGFSEKGKSTINMTYDSFTGLLTSHTGGDRVIKDGSLFMYKYNSLGRISSVILPTGEVLHFSSEMSVYNDHLDLALTTPLKSHLQMTDGMKHPYSMDVRTSNNNYNKYTLSTGMAKNHIKSFMNGSFSFHSAQNENLVCLAEETHPLLKMTLPTEAEILPILNKFVSTRGDLVNVMAWNYELVGDAASSKPVIRKKLRVNNDTVLVVDYNPRNTTEVIYSKNRRLMSITYAQASLPSQIKLANKEFAMDISYDRYNRIINWSWGAMAINFTYNQQGLLAESKSVAGSSTKYLYDPYWNKITQIELPSGNKLKYFYDDHGGLQRILLPSGLEHKFSAVTTLGLIRYTYLPPGFTKPYMRHYSYTGVLLEDIFPADGVRILYKYLPTGKLSEMVSGEGVVKISYSPETNLPNSVDVSENDLEYRIEFEYTNGLLTSERIEYAARNALSNAKFNYEYDNNFRVACISGRIGGQTIPPYLIHYDAMTGTKSLFGPFKTMVFNENASSITDGTATFVKVFDEYLQLSSISLNIHKVEVFRVEFSRDTEGRIIRIDTYTKHVGINSFKQTKYYKWDADGQLVMVDLPGEPWYMQYDLNGNMLRLDYREQYKGSPIKISPMQRIQWFQDKTFEYNSRGYMTKNVHGEQFKYNNKGFLVRVLKEGGSDIRYNYDYTGRMISRKDNYGNVTQFFYTNMKNPNEVSYIYSSRDEKLVTLTYDERGHLSLVQVFRHKYYIATDQCGTPVMIFNQYGEIIREMIRSPYGLIVYDSNPYHYLPIDFCGGLFDQVTSLVHMPNGKVYNPIIGQWNTPMWEGMLDRAYEPRRMHLYRFNGNDPVNVKQESFLIKDENAWLSRLAYDVESLAPQLTSPKSMSPSVLTNNDNDLGIAPLYLISSYFENFNEKLDSEYLTLLPSSDVPVDARTYPDFGGGKVASDVGWGFPMAAIYNPLKGAVYPKQYENARILEQTPYPATVSFNYETLFGYGILFSTLEDGLVLVNSIDSANAIYKDVLVSVFNNSHLLPFSQLMHTSAQNLFYFVKKDIPRAFEDKLNLKRLGSNLNTTFHEKDDDGVKTVDIRIHHADTVFNIRYGITVERETQRLLRHAKSVALKKAWHREREALRAGSMTEHDWAPHEREELEKDGRVAGYTGEYRLDVGKYPELCEDPSNVKFIKSNVPDEAEHAVVTARPGRVRGGEGRGGKGDKSKRV